MGSTQGKTQTVSIDHGPVPLESVLCTEELSRRPSRPPDYATENQALVFLAQALADSPRTILQKLADKILEVLQADSAGISLLTKEDGGKKFYWPAIAGVWKPHIGGGTPRDFGPCGDVLDRNAPLLFRHIERRYAYFLPIKPPVEECLLAPFYVENKAVGTIWVIAHDERRRFDAEDLRQLESLSQFASAAYQTVEFQEALRLREEALRGEVTERKRATEDLGLRTAQYETLLNRAPLGVYLVDSNFRIRQVNPIALPIFGDIPGLIGRSFDEVTHRLWTREYADEVVRIFRHTLETGASYETPERTEYRIDRGVTEHYEWRTDRIPLPEGGYGVVCYIRDISAQVLASAAMAESQERLRQSSKMDAIGRLAGGVAHEVNNQMTVVLGCSDFLLRRSDVPPAIAADLRHIRQAGERSATITQQLLAFGRRQILQPEVVDLNALVADLAPVLRRTMGEDMLVELRLVPRALPVLADVQQLQQVLINLALNAQDAMPGGGTLRLETSEDRPYTVLTVGDTGRGMDPDTLGHIFEPFFTTKPIGEGTGLGLATVYGIVKQLNGHIRVESTPGKGTSFIMSFPSSEATAKPSRPAVPVEHGNSSATVLVAEDSESVREMMTRTLREEGYDVLEATSGGEAVAMLERDPSTIALLVTDAAMPGIGGRELSERLARLRPGVPTLFVSGYPGPEIIRRGLLQEGLPFLQKPFAPDELAAEVRRLLRFPRGGS